MIKKKLMTAFTFLVCIGSGAFSQNFFPENSLSNIETVETIIQNWYGEQLSALGEEIIYNRESELNTIRFTCLRTFDNPFSIRIDWDDQNSDITFRMTDGAGGYSPGILIRDIAFSITQTELDNILAVFTRNNFWKLPVNSEDFGLDGSQWIIEYKTADKYKAVNWWTPENNAVSEIGNAIIKLSGVEIDNLY